MTIVVTIQRSREAAGGTRTLARSNTWGTRTHNAEPDSEAGSRRTTRARKEPLARWGNYCADAMIDRDDQTPRPRPTRWPGFAWGIKPSRWCVQRWDPRGHTPPARGLLLCCSGGLLAPGGHAKRDGTRRAPQRSWRDWSRAVTNRCHIAHLRAGMCTRKCCQAENHTSHRRAWTGGMAPTVYQCGHVRSLATRLRTRRRGGTVACTCVCMRDESAIIARGVLRQYEYRCFLILGRHPLVLYVSVVLARCVRRMRGQIHQASVHQRRQRARRCAYPQHNHNITCLGGSTCSQRSHARDPSHIALDIAPNHRQASRHHPHPTGGEREV